MLPDIAITETPLSVDAALAAVSAPGVGGVVVFVGTVRDNDGPDGAERGVSALEYSAHPTALRELAVVAGAVSEAHPDVRLAAHHRTGPLAVGDLAVVVVAAAPHRHDAFVAARTLIDDLKARVPIWKHQTFDDGSEEWVGLP
jgi:molybdopterin synthase catalytic subunit